MHPNTTKLTETLVQGPVGWMGCVGFEKLQCDFVARTFVLILPVQYVLQQVSCSYATIPNAPKYYEMHRNIGIGSNGCDRCEKSRHDFVVWTFAIIALVQPILHWVSCSYETIPNASKHYETSQNMSLGSNGVDQVRLLRKFTTWLRGTNFCINCTSSVCFASSFMQLQNNPKCTEILWNRPKH